MIDAAAMAWSAVVFAGGVALGGMFYGGLWLTMRWLTKSRNAGSALLIPLSFLARTALVLAGIYWLTRGDWRYVLVCLAGFLLARWAIIKQVSRSQPSLSTRESSDHEHVAG